MEFEVSNALEVAKSNAGLISVNGLKKLVGKKVTAISIIHDNRIILYDGILRNYSETFHPRVLGGISIDGEEWVAYIKPLLGQWQKAESGECSKWTIVSADVLFDGAQYYRVHAGELRERCEYCDVYEANHWLSTYKKFQAITPNDPTRGNTRNMFSEIDNGRGWRIVRWALSKYSRLIIKHFGEKLKRDVEKYLSEKERWQR